MSPPPQSGSTWLPGAEPTELANFDDNEGHVVGQGAGAPRGRALEDGLFHFGPVLVWPTGGLTLEGPQRRACLGAC